MLCIDAKNYMSSAKGLPFFYQVGDDEYQQAIKDFLQAGATLVRMSDFCPKEDKLPNVDELVDFLRTADVDYRSNKYVVIGLGEYLALLGTAFAEKELRRLKDTTLGNARAILLFKGLSAPLKRVISEDNRLFEQNRVYINETLPSAINVINVTADLSIIPEKGIKPILRALEDGNTGTILGTTALVFDDSLITIKTLTSAYSAIKMVVNDFDVDKKVGTEEQWKRLLNDLNKTDNNLDAVFEKYNISDWISKNFHLAVSGLDYRNWLVFLYLKVKVNQVDNCYLVKVLDNTTSFHEFKTNLLVNLTEITHEERNYKALYNDRKTLLKDFPEEDIAIFVKRNEVDPTESIFRLTDNTEIEKKAVVEWVSHYGINDALEYVYPALYEYLSLYRFNCPVFAEELTTYFDMYKIQKVTNRITDEFVELVQRYATTMAYAQLPTRDNAIKAVPNKKDAYLYWIDALGVEYLSYITALAKKYGLSMHTEIVRSDLPTITSVNKGFFEQWNGGKKYKEEELDNIKHKHKGGYFFTEDEDPIHIPAELNVIAKAMRTAALELGTKKCKSFILASDHGASRLAVLKKQEVPYETDTKGEHSGRCCKAFDGCDLPYKVEENGYIVLSDYGRFKGSRAANVEVHGGASLEEVVIPIITLTLKNNADVVIKVLHPDDIIADKKKGISLLIYISDVDNVDNVRLAVEEKSYMGSIVDETHFTFEIGDIKRSRSKPFEADIFDGDNLIGKISFKVKGKAATINDDFDFGDDF